MTDRLHPESLRQLRALVHLHGEAAIRANLSPRTSPTPAPTDMAIVADQIFTLMNGHAWDADTCQAIADVFRRAGRPLADTTEARS